MSERPAHPPPPINRDVRFLYEGFNRGKLLIQECDRCARLRHPPGPFCPYCHGAGWTAKEASGAGRVHSYTVHHHPPIPPWPLPHTVVLADMREGFRFVASVAQEAAAGAAGPVIGQPVRLVFVEVSAGYFLPQFRLERTP